MQHPTRIAFVSQFTDIVGGGEHSLLDLLRYRPAHWAPVLVTPGAGRLAELAGEAGVDVAALPMPGIGPRSLIALRAWLAWLRRERPVLIHANNSRAAFYAGLAGRWLGIPVVFHCRISDRDPRLDWLVARLATRIVANSRATAGRFAPAFSGKVEVIYNGIALPDHPPGPDKAVLGEDAGRRMVLCVARVSRWKRHDLVLDAFSRLAEAAPDLLLVMLGGADPFAPAWMDELRQRSASMGCGDRIRWLGTREDVDAWYRAADVLVLASREEPFGRVVIEAMAQGLPVVAAASGGPAEIIDPGRTGVLVRDDAPEAWADALRSVLEDAELRERLVCEGRRRAADFSIDAHVQAMDGMFERVLKTTP